MSKAKNDAVVDTVNYITVDKAAEILHKSPHCIRQLLLRKKLARHKIGHNTFVDLESALTYHARKKGLPSWEENVSLIKNKAFISLEKAADKLMVQTSYITRLVQDKLIEGYVTTDGNVMIAVDTINTYLRRPDANTANDL